jgi:hypothetical protein
MVEIVGRDEELAFIAAFVAGGGRRAVDDSGGSDVHIVRNEDS